MLPLVYVSHLPLIMYLFSFSKYICVYIKSLNEFITHQHDFDDKIMIILQI